jgi:molybdopterin-guanine dinucleotide biosynthesis protein A
MAGDGPDTATGAGVVLAGGRSTRYGEGDEALADLAGTPMLRRVADELRTRVESLVVNCRPERTDALREAMAGHPSRSGSPRIPGRTSARSAASETGLRAVADHEYAFVVACDMPFLAAGFVAHLFDRAAGHDAAVPRVDEWFQTTHAVDRADAMAAACDDALDRGEGKVLAALEQVEYVVVGSDEPEAYATTEVSGTATRPKRSGKRPASSSEHRALSPWHPPCRP